MRKQKCHDHRTGRKCVVPNCGGNLYDTIINFNECLNQSTLDKAEQNTNQCDVMLALGSSLTVTPAADMPEEVGLRWANEVQNGQNPKNNLVIVNLQKTPLDNVASIRIFAKIDDVMVPLMKELGLEIPEWKLQRFMKVKVDPIEDEEDQKLLTISAVDVDGIDATVFQNVQLRHNGNPIVNPKVKIIGDTRRRLKEFESENKFKFRVSNDMVIPVDDQKENDNESESGLVAELSFMGNYTEPNLCIPLCPLLQNLGSSEFVCRLVMDIESKKWSVHPVIPVTANAKSSGFQPFNIHKRPKDDVEDDTVKESREVTESISAMSV